jgi:hypothetical protein
MKLQDRGNGKNYTPIVLRVHAPMLLRKMCKFGKKAHPLAETWVGYRSALKNLPRFKPNGAALTGDSDSFLSRQVACIFGFDIRNFVGFGWLAWVSLQLRRLLSDTTG